MTMRRLSPALPLALLFFLVFSSACDRGQSDLFSDEDGVIAEEGGDGVTEPRGAHDAPLRRAPQTDEGERGGAADVDVDMPDPALASAARERVDFEVPSHWVEEEASSTMRVAQWVLPVQDEAVSPGECVLFHFPGGGRAEDNLFRWIGQFEQPDGSSSEDVAVQAEVESQHADIAMVKVEGTYLEQNPPMTGPVERREGFGLHGAVLEVSSGDPWFLKCTGPSDVVEANEGAIVHFLRSFRLRG